MAPGDDEVQVGAGKYSVTARGGLTIAVLFGFAILGLLGWLAVRQQENFDTLAKLVTVEHRENERLTRLVACVGSLTLEEKVWWRSSREANAALVSLCPGLLLSP